MSEKKPKLTDASQAMLDKAIAKHQAGDTATAKALYNELLNTEQKAHGLHLLGVISHQEGNNTKAIELIENALKVEPGLISGRFNLANIYLGIGDKEKAFQLFHQCTQLKPDYLEAHYQCGLLLGEHGKYSEAIDSFNAVIALDSSHAASYLQKGVCETHHGKAQEAITTLGRACELDPSNADCFFGLGNAYSHGGEKQAALKLLDKAIQLNPVHYRSWNNRGVIFLDLAQHDDAQACFERALSIHPSFVEAHNNLGNVLRALGRYEEARACYSRAIAHQPTYADGHYNLGVVLSDLGDFEPSIASYEIAIQLNPRYWRAYINLGAVLHRHFKQPDKARGFFETVISNDPSSHEAFFNLGNAVKDLGDVEGAINNYRAALRLKPDYYDALNNLGLCQKEVGSFQDALQSYQAALRFKPDYARALNNLGVLYRLLDEPDASLNAYNTAISIDPKFVDAFNNRGNLFKEFGRLDQAIADYEMVHSLDPDYDFFFGTLQHARMKACDWRGYEGHLNYLRQGIEEGRYVTPPFPPLSLFDDPGLHARNTRTYAEKMYPAKQLDVPIPELRNNGKIRLAYFSSDFYNHATSYLIAELLELQSRDKFHLIGISWGPRLTDSMSSRVRLAFDEYHEVHDLSDPGVAKLSRSLGVDIAIDLKGYTSQCRTGIFACRCAPIQINYLGYPGSMQSSYFDYIIADPFLIPAQGAQYFSEKVIYLPDTYQVNDRKRPISSTHLSRKECGLPVDAFVFCCFNNNYKITPSIFDVWARILLNCPNSVLWLFKDNELVVGNLRREAQARGVDPNRIFFAERMSLEDHLRRHQCADLMLDTFPYSAHTTASDSLWAGLPLLTLVGESFASRVAASLLHACNLSELVAHNQCDYFFKAVKFYENPQALHSIRKGLRNGRDRFAIFDSQRFVANFEEALLSIKSNNSIDRDAHN